jgi:UDP-2,4-diacetamido-2,4,6-trideoxy-beta-L-altropyranose hydrolase
MRVAIRVDAAAWIGIGHLKRCMALADALRRVGAKVLLVSRALDQTAPALLEESGLRVTWLAPPAGEPTLASEGEAPMPAHHTWARVAWLADAREAVAITSSFEPDWVVVDHYAFDARWHKEVRSLLNCRIAVIDDLADRSMDADLLVDHNWAPDHRVKYARRVAPETPILGGPAYALLDNSYASAPRCVVNPGVQSIGIFMGGTDPGNISPLVVKACRADVRFEGPVEVVSSVSNPHLDELRRACAAWPGTTLTLDLPNLATFFARHDLQIGAGGGATWERCCIGAPSVVLAVAHNQESVVNSLAQRRVAHAAALSPAQAASEDPSTPDLVQAVREMIADWDLRKSLAERAASLVDGRGAQRVALRLARDALSLRNARESDALVLYAWRNHESVRLVSHNRGTISFAEHEQWVKQVLANPQRWLFIAHVNGCQVGAIRFDIVDEQRKHHDLKVSLNLDPALQGIGLGSRLLAAGEHAMQRLQTGPFAIRADVLPENLTSQRLFERGHYRGGPLHFVKSFT